MANQKATLSDRRSPATPQIRNALPSSPPQMETESKSGLRRGASLVATPEDASSQLSLSGIMHLLESSVAGESPAATPSHVRAWPGFVTKVTRPKLVIVPHLFQALRHLPLYLSGLCAGSICNLRTSPSGLTH